MANETLREEISVDPLGRGYDTMTDAEVAADLNDEYRTIQLDSLSGSEIFDETDSAEFAALSDTEKDRWLNLCGIGNVDPFGPAVAVATSLFSGGSTTLTNLEALREPSVSRATELGLPEVKAYDVEKAREQLGVS